MLTVIKRRTNESIFKQAVLRICIPAKDTEKIAGVPHLHLTPKKKWGTPCCYLKAAAVFCGCNFSRCATLTFNAAKEVWHTLAIG
jgi:hypothetical protein